MPAAPAPHTSVAQFTPANKTTDESSKPVGAYRPPGARGTATPSIYKREDEGGAAVMPSANGSGAIYVPGTRTPRSRNIPGAPPGAAKPNGNEGKGKKNKKNGAATGGNATPAASAPSTPAVEVPPPIADGDADATQKKIRNLNKKVSLWSSSCHRVVVEILISLLICIRYSSRPLLISKSARPRERFLKPLSSKRSKARLPFYKNSRRSKAVSKSNKDVKK
jgi:hypothetical protein